MSYGALSKEAKIALAMASTLAGTSTNSGEGGTFKEERKAAKRLVVQWASGRFGTSIDYLMSAEAIEVKIGQGAKPGMGGHLLARKVTKEIAKIRGIPQGADALSPARFLDIIKPGDLKKHVEMLREATNSEKPIIVKLGPGRVKEDVKLVVEAGADCVAIGGMEGGTAASPEVAIEHAGIPTLAVIAPAVEALEELDVREEVDLIIMGGIKSGADVAKALALGADAVCIGSAALIAMGCRVCEQCFRGVCQFGICTQDPELRKRLDVKEAAQRVANLIKAMTEELITLTMLSGHKSVAELSREDLRALNINAALIAGVKLPGFERYLSGKKITFK
jgi:glutamate synthase domain-containing protein 2